MSVEPSTEERDQRPTSVLLATTWDVILATFAIFGAAVSFGTGEEIRGRQVDVGIWEQLLNAVSYATLAAVLIILAVMMARRLQRLRTVQITVLCLHAGLLLLQAAVAWIDRTPGDAGAAQTVYRNLLYALIDGAAAYALTSGRARAWFREPGGVAKLLTVPVVVWVVTSLAVLGVDVIRGIQG